MKDTVFVFARAPRLGVKRRLAAGIGARAALQFYRATLARTLRRLARDRRFRIVVAVTPDRARGPWLRAMGLRGLPSVPQGGGDLGRRLQRATDRVRRGRVAIVGSDIPELRAADVAAAFRMLSRGTACFGPAADGGYWLVGFARRRPPAPFARVRWSTSHALADTLANLGRHRAGLLRTLRDVDDAADFRAVRR